MWLRGEDLFVDQAGDTVGLLLGDQGLGFRPDGRGGAGAPRSRVFDRAYPSFYQAGWQTRRPRTEARQELVAERVRVELDRRRKGEVITYYNTPCDPDDLFNKKKYREGQESFAEYWRRRHPFPRLDAANRSPGKPCSKARDGFMPRHCQGRSGLQFRLSSIRFKRPRLLNFGVQIEACDEPPQQVRAIGGRQFQGFGFQDFQMCAQSDLLGAKGSMVRSCHNL